MLGFSCFQKFCYKLGIYLPSFFYFHQSKKSPFLIALTIPCNIYPALTDKAIKVMYWIKLSVYIGITFIPPHSNLKSYLPAY